MTKKCSVTREEYIESLPEDLNASNAEISIGIDGSFA